MMIPGNLAFGVRCGGLGQATCLLRPRGRRAVKKPFADFGGSSFLRRGGEAFQLMAPLGQLSQPKFLTYPGSSSCVCMSGISDFWGSE